MTIRHEGMETTYGIEFVEIEQRHREVIGEAVLRSGTISVMGESTFEDRAPRHTGALARSVTLLRD
jgi:hypothetical protein